MESLPIIPLEGAERAVVILTVALVFAVWFGYTQWSKHRD